MRNIWALVSVLCVLCVGMMIFAWMSYHSPQGAARMQDNAQVEVKAALSPLTPTASTPGVAKEGAQVVSQDLTDMLNSQEEPIEIKTEILEVVRSIQPREAPKAANKYTVFAGRQPIFGSTQPQQAPDLPEFNPVESASGPVKEVIPVSRPSGFSSAGAPVDSGVKIAAFIPQSSNTGPGSAVANGKVKKLPGFTPIINKTGPVKD